MSIRPVARVEVSQPTVEGAGVRLRRAWAELRAGTLLDTR